MESHIRNLILILRRGKSKGKPKLDIALPVCLLISLVSCSTVLEPSYYRMSDSELAAYNETRPIEERINCVLVPMENSMDMKKLCGTLAEIQENIQPLVPGARTNSFSFFPLVDEKSRATNPPIRPTTDRRQL